MRHPSLASVEWQDLRQLSLGETVYNICLFYYCHGGARGKGGGYLHLWRLFSFLLPRLDKRMIAITAL